MNQTPTPSDLFDFMLERIKKAASEKGFALPQAFGYWFANLYTGQEIIDLIVTDGKGDGKIDVLVSYQKGNQIKYHIINCKFTEEYDKTAPVKFYDEITRFWQAFKNIDKRNDYLKVVRDNFKDLYKKMFLYFDAGTADLLFVTNYSINTAQYETIRNDEFKVKHLDELLQYVIEYIENAMPESEPITLSGITTVLSHSDEEKKIPISVVFARLVDFIKYMDNDPYGLLFARNVRLWLKNTETNKEISKTFRDNPEEFAFSNNGITILCDKQTYDPGKKQLVLENPRIVNGSQTLHCAKMVNGASNRAITARVMLRIIEIPPSNLVEKRNMRKQVTYAISVRTNMQNKIEKWNLVCNDDFQNAQSRYFWDKKIYYERRQDEWQDKKLLLQKIGIKQGPNIVKLTQLIASYYVNEKGLGPAIAKGQKNQLFRDEPYKIICSTNPEIVYQLYLIGEIMRSCLKDLRAGKKYIKNIGGYIDFILFSLICIVLTNCQIKWGSVHFTNFLERENEIRNPKWQIVVKQLIDHINADYNNANKLFFSKENFELTYANYYKSKSYMNNLLVKPVPNQSIAKIKEVLQKNKRQ